MEHLNSKRRLEGEGIYLTFTLVLIFAQFCAEAHKYPKFNTKIMRSQGVCENEYIPYFLFLEKKWHLSLKIS